MQRRIRRRPARADPPAAKRPPRRAPEPPPDPAPETSRGPGHSLADLAPVREPQRRRPGNDPERGTASSGVSEFDLSALTPLVQRTPGPTLEELRKSGRAGTPGGSEGLPAGLRAGVESLSGLDLGGVRVRRNASEPGEIGARAFTRGEEIFLGPGAEAHLPHEAWHVVQQRQGRVPVTTRFSGVAGNDDPALEREADREGSRAMATAPTRPLRRRLSATRSPAAGIGVSQRVEFGDLQLNKKRRKALIGLELAFNNAFTRASLSNTGTVVPPQPVPLELPDDAGGPPTPVATASQGDIVVAIQKMAQKWVGFAQRHAATNHLTLKVESEAHPQGAEHVYGGAFGEETVQGAEGEPQTRPIGRLRFRYTGLGLSGSPWEGREEEWGDGEEPLVREADDLRDWQRAEPLKEFVKSQGTWWWGLTLDPAVFEIQTHPATWQVLHDTAVRDIVQGAIFDGAAWLGLTADKGIGGGQVNVDFATGFGGRHAAVLETLQRAEEAGGPGGRWEASGLHEDDGLNAPYIYKSSRAQPGKKALPAGEVEDKWRAIYKTHRGRIDDEGGWEAFLAEFRGLLGEFPSLIQGQRDYLTRQEEFMSSQTHAEDVTHFQAVNVGHVAHPNESLRRVEFRDLKAQANPAEVFAAIDLVLSLTPEVD